MLRLQIKRFSLVSSWLSFMLIPSARTEDITLIVGHEEEKCFFILLKNHFINKIVELKSDDVLLFSILINVRTLPTKLIRFERFIWNISSCPTLNLMSASQTLGAHLQSAYLKLVIICFFHKISNFFLCTKLTHITLLYIYLYIEHSSITLHLFFHCVKHTWTHFCENERETNLYSVRPIARCFIWFAQREYGRSSIRLNIRHKQIPRHYVFGIAVQLRWYKIWC